MAQQSGDERVIELLPGQMIYLDLADTGYSMRLRKASDHFLVALANLLADGIVHDVFPWDTSVRAGKVYIELPGMNQRGEPNHLVVSPVYWLEEPDGKRLIAPESPNASLLMAIYRDATLRPIGVPRFTAHPDIDYLPGRRVRLLQERPPEGDPHWYPLTQQQVLSGANAEGCGVSERTLLDYQKLPILPAFHNHPTSSVRYPSDTVARLQAILWLKKHAGIQPKRLRELLRPAWLT